MNYDGEMHIIEEVKLFQNAEPIDVLRLHQNQVRKTGTGYRSVVLKLFWSFPTLDKGEF